MIRVDHGAKNALQTLLQHALDVGKSDSVDSLITHLPKILPDAGKSSLSTVVMRCAGGRDLWQSCSQALERPFTP